MKLLTDAEYEKLVSERMEYCLAIYRRVFLSEHFKPKLIKRVFDAMEADLHRSLKIRDDYEQLRRHE